MSGDRFGRIHRLFNHEPLLRWARRVRVPIVLAAAVLLAFNTRPEWFWPGLVVSGVGELLQLWCFASLHKQQALATNGPYKVVRNPMYLARFLLILGCVMFAGSAVLVAAYVVLYYFYMVNRVRREEERLLRIFGEPYREYCRRVGRFIPFRGINPDGVFFYFKPAYFWENHGHWNGLGQVGFYFICYVLTFRPFS